MQACDGGNSRDRADETCPGLYDDGTHAMPRLAWRACTKAKRTPIPPAAAQARSRATSHLRIPYDDTQTGISARSIFNRTSSQTSPLHSVCRCKPKAPWLDITTGSWTVCPRVTAATSLPGFVSAHRIQKRKSAFAGRDDGADRRSSSLSRSQAASTRRGAKLMQKKDRTARLGVAHVIVRPRSVRLQQLGAAAYSVGPSAPLAAQPWPPAISTVPAQPQRPTRATSVTARGAKVTAYTAEELLLQLRFLVSKESAEPPAPSQAVRSRL